MSVRFVIDALDFVRKAGEHHGRMPVADLSRIHDFLYENKGEVEYCVKGIVDRNERPYLHLIVMGNMVLRCQRCLGKLDHKLDIKTALQVVETEEKLVAADEDDSVGALLTAADIDVQDLVEDEIILSLSIASRHNEGECDIYNPEQYKAKECKNAENPFSILKTLK